MEDLSSRVDAERTLEHSLLSYDLRQWLSQQFIENHSFVYIILDHDDPGELSEYFCNVCQLRLAEDLSDWILRRGDDDDLGAFVECGLELVEVEVPFILFAGSQLSLCDTSQQLCFGVLNEDTVTLFLGRRGIPMVFPPAICTCGR